MMWRCVPRRRCCSCGVCPVPAGTAVARKCSITRDGALSIMPQQITAGVSAWAQNLRHYENAGLLQAVRRRGISRARCQRLSVDRRGRRCGFSAFGRRGSRRHGSGLRRGEHRRGGPRRNDDRRCGPRLNNYWRCGSHGSRSRPDHRCRWWGGPGNGSRPDDGGGRWCRSRGGALRNTDWLRRRGGLDDWSGDRRRRRGVAFRNADGLGCRGGLDDGGWDRRCVPFRIADGLGRGCNRNSGLDHWSSAGRHRGGDHGLRFPFFPAHRLGRGCRCGSLWCARDGHWRSDGQGSSRFSGFNRRGFPGRLRLLAGSGGRRRRDHWLSWLWQDVDSRAARRPRHGRHGRLFTLLPRIPSNRCRWLNRLTGFDKRSGSRCRGLARLTGLSRDADGRFHRLTGFHERSGSRCRGRAGNDWLSGFGHCGVERLSGAEGFQDAGALCAGSGSR